MRLIEAFVLIEDKQVLRRLRCIGIRQEYQEALARHPSSLPDRTCMHLSFQQAAACPKLWTN